MADTISGITHIAGVAGQARVSVVDINTNTIVDSQLSDASTGVFSFSGLAAGTYEIVIQKAGYKPLCEGPWTLDGLGPLDLATEILADAPWAYYQLGEGWGAASALDSSGNSRHLTVVNPTVTFSSAALCAPGTSADFNGTGYLTCTNNEFGSAQAAAFNGNVAVTYCFVVDADALGSAVPFHLGDVSTSGSQGLFVELLSSGAIRMQYYDTVYGWQFFDSAAGVVAVGTPSIVHVRREVGGACTIFHNGASVATNASPPGNIGMSSGSLRIMVGAMNMSTPTNPLNGDLQHVAVFDSALSDARIAAHAAAFYGTGPVYRSRLQFGGADASTTFTDDTGLIWTTAGGAQVDTALGDQRGLFNGASAYVTTPDAAGINFGTGDFKISFIQRYNSLSGYQTVLSKGYSVAGGLLVQTGNGNGLLNVYVDTLGTLVMSESGSLSAGVDYLVEIERIGTAFTITRNGVLTASGSNAINLASTAVLAIGGGSNTGFNNFWFNGWVKDFRIT